MKLKLTFLFLLSISTLFADCTDFNISVWPTSRTIPKNTIFIIEGYANAEGIIRTLTTSHKIYLQGRYSVIPLKIIEMNVGEFNLTQAVLKPEQPLITNEKYSLIIENRNSQVYVSENRWLVNEIKDHKRPKWISKPSYLGNYIQYFGCGPEVMINYSCCTKDDSPIVVLTKLTSLKSGKSVKYYLASDSSMLKIGHSMCAGAFTFMEGEKYTVQFTLMDASGNKTTLWNSKEIINRPTANNSEEKDRTSCKCNEKTNLKKFNSVIISVFLFLIFILLFLLFKKKILHAKSR